MRKGSSSVYWVILLFITFVGLGALAVRLVEGLRVTNMTSIVSWGLWVAFYIYFIGLSAGSFLVSSLIYVFGFRQYEKAGKLAIFAALIALLAGLSFITIDLGHMERLFNVFLTPNFRSVLTWEIFFYVAYIFILLGELWFLMRADFVELSKKAPTLKGLYSFLTFRREDLSPEALERDKRVVKVLGSIGIPIALGVHGGTGAIFAVIKAQPYWFTGLFPLIFVVSALASGGALITFLYAFWGRKDEDHSTITQSLGKLATGFIIFDLSLLFLEFLITLYSEIPEHTLVLDVIMKGQFWWTFWILQLLVGAVIPLILIFGPTGRSPVWVGIASLFVVIGVMGVRWNIVTPTLVVPQFLEIPKAFFDPRLSTKYVPSLVEWLSSLGIIGLMMVLFSLGYVSLPLVKPGREEG